MTAHRTRHPSGRYGTGVAHHRRVPPRGSDVRATAGLGSAADHGGVDIDFTGFAGDCIISGRFRLGSRRLTDELNQAPTITLHDVVLDGLDGQQVTTPTFTIERSQLCAVVGRGPRGRRSLRIATDRRRLQAQIGPYVVLGRYHGPLGGHDPAHLRRAGSAGPADGRHDRLCRRRHPRGRGRLDAHRQPRARVLVSRSRRRLRARSPLDRPPISPRPPQRLIADMSRIGRQIWRSRRRRGGGSDRTSRCVGEWRTRRRTDGPETAPASFR